MVGLAAVPPVTLDYRVAINHETEPTDEQWTK